MGVLKSSHVIAHGLHRALAQTRSHTPRSDTRNVDIYATYHQISMLLLQFCRRYVLTYDHMLAGNTVLGGGAVRKGCGLHLVRRVGFCCAWWRRGGGGLAYWRQRANIARACDALGVKNISHRILLVQFLCLLS